MTDDRPDLHPYGPTPDGESDSIENLDRPTNDESPDARNGAVGGTDGVTKNQDDDAQ